MSAPRSGTSSDRAAKRAICRAMLQSTIRRESRGRATPARAPATGAKGSPASASRSSTAGASSDKVSTSPDSTSSQVSGAGDRGALARPQGQGPDGGLAAGVLAPVDEHLPGALALAHHGHHQVAVCAPGAALRVRGRTAWCRRNRRRSSAGCTPASPSSRRSSRSSPGSAGPVGRATAAPPRSTRPAPRAGRGRGRRPPRSGDPASAARASEGCSSRSARLASQMSVGRSSQSTKSIVRSPAAMASERTHSGACEGFCFS